MGKCVRYRTSLMFSNLYSIDVKLKLEVVEDGLRRERYELPLDLLKDSFDSYTGKYFLMDSKDILPFIKFVLSRLNSEFVGKFGVFFNVVNMSFESPRFRRKEVVERIFDIVREEIKILDEKTKNYLMIGESEDVIDFRKSVRDIIDGFIEYTTNFGNPPKVISHLLRKRTWKAEDEAGGIDDPRLRLFKRMVERLKLGEFHDRVNSLEILRTYHLNYISKSKIHIVLLKSPPDSSFFNGLRRMKDKRKWLFVSPVDLDEDFQFIHIDEKEDESRMIGMRVNISKKLRDRLYDVLFEEFKGILKKRVERELKMKDRCVITVEEFGDLLDRNGITRIIEDLKDEFDIFKSRDFLMFKSKR